MKSLLSLLPYIKKYKKKLTLGFIFIVLSISFSSLFPLIVGNGIDAIKSGVTSSQIIFYSGMAIVAALIGGFFLYMVRQHIIVEVLVDKGFLVLIQLRVADHQDMVQLQFGKKILNENSGKLLLLVVDNLFDLFDQFLRVVIELRLGLFAHPQQIPVIRDPYTKKLVQII